MKQPQAAHGFDGEVIELVGVGAAAVPGDGFQAVDGAALGVGSDEGFVAGLLDVAADFFVGLIPTDVFPMIGAGAADSRLKQAALIHNVLHERGSFGTERAAINGMIRVAFDVDHLGRDVLGFVADGVDDNAAAHRAIGAGGAGFGGAGDFQFFRLGVGGS